MPRTSRAIACLDKQEEALKAKHAQLIAELGGVEHALAMVAEMRRDMLALPKRTSRAKNRVAPAANAAPATTTVA